MAEFQPVAEPDVDDDPEETVPMLLTEQTSAIIEDPIDESAFAREDHPGRPVCAVPVVSVEGLATGDHVILETSLEPYRPCYQSGLVVEIDVRRGRMLLIRNKKEGVSKEWVLFQSFHKVNIVQYTLCQYAEEEAIGRAEHRVKWEESLYHPLFNNSHHLVTWAKTGREYPLTEIIKDFEYTGNTHPLDPVLTKTKVSNLEDLKSGDHIMINSDHWLVQSIDLESNRYTAFMWNGKKVVQKERKLERNGKTFQIEYDTHALVLPTENAIENAKKAAEGGDGEAQGQVTFTTSDEFVTMMKTGKRYVLNDSCLFRADNGPVSYTPVTANIAIDEGDHLIVKDAEGKLHSVLLYKYIGEGVVVTMPDISSTALYGQIDLTNCEEIIRINYREFLPIDVVLKRACSQVGEAMLKGYSQAEADKFVSWAKTGHKLSTDIARLQQETKPQVAQIRPWERMKVVSIDGIEIGDHLIQRFRGRWFHFMVTERNIVASDPYKAKIIYCFRGAIGEKVARIDLRKDDVYKILYPECLPTEVAVQRARSRLGSRKLSPLARMWFVRWAKTGSDEGLEVDFLANNAFPVTKSQIVSFFQLNPGDYLVEKKQKLSRWHHYLVTEVHSPTQCSVIESWGTPSPDKVKESQLTLSKDTTIYRLNYNDGACVSPACAIATAREKVGKSFSAGSKYTRQKFVNHVKTREAAAISVDDVLDDRLFIPRERIESLPELKPGDHIECSEAGKSTFQHMLVIETIDQDRIKVLRCRSCLPKGVDANIEAEELRLFEKSQEVFRVNYPERIPPHESLQLHQQVTGDASVAEGKSQEELSGGDQCILAAVLGDPISSIQVDEKLHSVLQYRKENALKPFTTALGSTATKSTSRQLTLSKTSTEESAKDAAGKALTRAGLKLAFKLSTRIALSSTVLGALAGGPGVGIFILIEGPILARGVYKLHRKKKFEQISEAEYKRGVVKETFTSANVVIGAVGGAIVGQILIPIPGVGAGIGGAVGTVAGQIAGKAEGHAFAKLVREKIVTLPIIASSSFTEIMPP